MTASTIGRAPALVLALLLSACGFQLRDALTLPPDLGKVGVASRDPYGALTQSLSRSLERAGVEVVDAGAGNAATLRIVSERWASTPISVDQFGRAQEFTLRYATVFSLTAADGRVLVPQQAVELARDYVSVPGGSTGTESERELLARELQREMASSILRRIDAAARAIEPQPVPAPEGVTEPEGDAAP